MVYHGSWWDIMIFIVPASFLMVPGLVFMVPGGFSWFQVSFHGSRSDFMVPGRFSWFFMVPGCFFQIENTIKLYSGLAIQSRPCRP